MAGPIEIDVWQGEIAELEVDAIVVGANESLFMTAGAAASVKRLGGDEIEREAVEQGPVPPGSAVATTAGSLAAGYVIHAVAVGHDRARDASRLTAAIRAALGFAAPLQLRRIATPLIGVEHGVFTPAEAAGALVETLVAGDTAGLESVVIATPHATEVQAATAALAARRAEAR